MPLGRRGRTETIRAEPHFQELDQLAVITVWFSQSLYRGLKMATDSPG